MAKKILILVTVKVLIQRRNKYPAPSQILAPRPCPVCPTVAQSAGLTTCGSATVAASPGKRPTSQGKHRKDKAMTMFDTFRTYTITRAPALYDGLSRSRHMLADIVMASGCYRVSVENGSEAHPISAFLRGKRGETLLEAAQRA